MLQVLQFMVVVRTFKSDQKMNSLLMFMDILNYYLISMFKDFCQIPKVKLWVYVILMFTDHASSTRVKWQAWFGILTNRLYAMAKLNYFLVVMVMLMVSNYAILFL